MSVIVIEHQSVYIDLGSASFDAVSHDLRRKTVGAVQGNMSSLVKLLSDDSEP